MGLGSLSTGEVTYLLESFLSHDRKIALQGLGGEEGEGERETAIKHHNL